MKSFISPRLLLAVGLLLLSLGLRAQTTIYRQDFNNVAPGGQWQDEFINGAPSTDWAAHGGVDPNPGHLGAHPVIPGEPGLQGMYPGDPDYRDPCPSAEYNDFDAYHIANSSRTTYTNDDFPARPGNSQRPGFVQNTPQMPDGCKIDAFIQWRNSSSNRFLMAVTGATYTTPLWQARPSTPLQAGHTYELSLDVVDFAADYNHQGATQDSRFNVLLLIGDVQYHSRARFQRHGVPGGYFVRVSTGPLVYSGSNQNIQVIIENTGVRYAPGNADADASQSYGDHAYAVIDNVELKELAAPTAPTVVNQSFCGAAVNPQFTISNPQANTTYEWYDSQDMTRLLQQSASATYQYNGTVSSSLMLYVRAKNSSGVTSALTPVYLTITPRTELVRYQQNFNNVAPGGKWQDEFINGSPSADWAAHGGVDPNPGHLGAHSIVPDIPRSAPYRDPCPSDQYNDFDAYHIANSSISTGTSDDFPPRSDTGQRAGFVENTGHTYDNCKIDALIRWRDAPSDRFLMAVTGASRNTPLWRARPATPLQPGHTYELSLDVVDFAATYHHASGTGDSRFNVRLFVGDVEYNSSARFQRHGVPGGYFVRVSSGPLLYSGSNQTIMVVIENTGVRYAPGNADADADQSYGDHAYIAIDNVELKEVTCGVPPQLASTDLYQCGSGALTFTVTSPGASLPSGHVYQWMAPDVNGVPQVLAPSPTTSPTFTVAMPTSTPTGATFTYSVAVVNTTVSPQEVGPATAVRATWRPQGANPTASAGTLCPGTRAPVTMTVSPTAAGMSYQWYDTDGTTPIASTNGGQSCTVTVSGPATYFVQAVPQGGANVGCPSGLTPVDIRLQVDTRPAVTIPSLVVRGNLLSASLTGDASYTYTWNWHDPDRPGLSTGMAATHTYDKLGTYDVELTYADTHAPPCLNTMRFTVTVGNKLCELTLDGTNLGGLQVQLSNRTGAYVVQAPVSATACLATSTIFDCLTGQGQGQEVVAASAVAYTGTPPASDAAYGLTAANLEANPFLAGGGRLRPEATYAYSTPVLATANYERSTERGRFLAVPFNWQMGGGNRLPAWLRAGQATRYSPDGETLEEQDVLRIYSTVKMGYKGHSLVYLTAKNAGYGQVLFESFEKNGADPAANALEGEDQFTVLSTEATRRDDYAHAGTHSVELTPSGSQAQLSLRAFQASWAGPVQVKFWLRASQSGSPAQALSQASLGAATLAVHWSGTSLPDSPVQIVAQTGDWLLCEASASGLPTTSFTPQIQLANLGSWRVWLDDVRVQPLAAQMTCSVYDPLSLRLLASFDDQHFGLYYQYNAEGKLVRKQVETMRGLKTIQETQYHSIQP
jgi:hypothetical protein